MRNVLIIKNISREAPGILEQLLIEYNIPYTIIDLEKGEVLPESFNYSALIVLGGPDSANDTTQKMQAELAYITKALDLHIPYLGICLGLQTLVMAAGGRVIKNRMKEIGFKDPKGGKFTINLTEEGKQDPLFLHLSDPFEVFHLHGETVVPTNRMHVLGTGEYCTNQIVKIADNAYGLQCHFELTKNMLSIWLNEDSDLLASDVKKIMDDFIAIEDSYTKTGEILFSNFLKIASLV